MAKPGDGRGNGINAPRHVPWGSSWCRLVGQWVAYRLRGRSSPRTHTRANRWESLSASRGSGICSRSGRQIVVAALIILNSGCGQHFAAGPQGARGGATATTGAARGPIAACGAWSSASGPVGSYFTAHYGEIRNCGLFGTTWVIATLGLKSQPGVIALYECEGRQPLCRSPQAIHPPADWQIYAAPKVGGVTIVGFIVPSCLIVDYGGTEAGFSIGARQFVDHC